MEVVACCSVGILAALCAAGILGCLDCSEAGGGEPRSGEEVRAVSRATAERSAAALGAALRGTGLLPAAVCGRLVGELRRLSVVGQEVLRALEDDAVLGLLAIASLLCGALLGVLSWSVPGALLGCAAPGAALWIRASARSRATESRVAEAMPEAFGALAISLESGLSLPQAMRYVGGHSEEPVRGHFMRASFSMSCGVSAADALDAMVSGFSAPGLELVTLALKISQRTGAPLKDLLLEASQLAGERIELARQLDVKTSQARMSAQLVAAMPVAMVGILGLLSSDFRNGLVTPTGAACVAVAMGLNAAAWLIIRRIMKVEL